MKKIRIAFFISILCFLISSPLFAAPGDYSLRVKGGPLFNISDWQNQGRLGGAFDYDLGYSLGFQVLAMFGISDTFRFDFMPNVRYNYLYIGPAALDINFGAGYGVYDTSNVFQFRFGTGLLLPLGGRFEFLTDASLYIAPAGTPGTPVTVEWLIGFGTKFF